MTFDPYQYLLNSTFRFLSFRSRSKKEIITYLEKKSVAKGISDDIKEKVVTHLEELRFIDDQKFAEAFVTSGILGRPKGPSQLRFELKRKGVADQIITSVLSNTEEFQDEGSEEGLARKALGKKGELYKNLPTLECKRKVHDYLGRRGFSSVVIRRLVDDYCGKSYNKAQEI